MVRAACAIGFFGLLPLGLTHAGTAPAFRLNMSTPAYLDTDMLGDETLSFGVILLNGGDVPVASHPITVKATLPAHVTPKLSALPNDPLNWQCSWSAPEVTCNYGKDLTAANWQSYGLAIALESDDQLSIPGSDVLRGTVENAQLPLPGTLDCTSTPSNGAVYSDTQCVEKLVDHRQSEVFFLPNTWSHNLATFEAGATSQQFSVGFQNLGFGVNHTPVSAIFQLPPGLTYVSRGGQVSWTCNAATPDAQGQLLTCTTPYFFDGMGPQQANIYVNVNVASNVPVPGPLKVCGTISNPWQPAPDMALCSSASPPLGCGCHDIPTKAAAQSRMDIVDVVPQQSEFVIGQSANVHVSFTNLGDGNANPAVFEFAVPSGFAYASQTALPSLNCSVIAGNTTVGQTLRCSYNGAYPPGTNGYVNLVFSVLANAAPQSLLVASAEDGGVPGPGLSACVADATNPEPMIGCGHAILYVSPWIFCDGFERIGRVCGQPQQFP